MLRRSDLELVAGFIFLVFVFTGAKTLAVEPELVERLPGPIDDHTVAMLDGARAMVAWESAIRQSEDRRYQR